MAYVQRVSGTETSITVRISDLSLPQNQYSSFQVRINGGSWQAITVTSSTLYYSGTHTFGGLSCGNSYLVEGRVYTNQWWPVDSVYASTSACPVPVLPGPPTGIWHSVNGLTVTVYFTKGTNANYTELDKYDGSNYLTTTGTSFTYSVPNYNTTYSYDMRSVNSAGTSSWTAKYSFTTGSPPAPSTPSAPTLYLNSENYRYEGGVRIGWGSVTGATSYVVKRRNVSTGAIQYFGVTTTDYESTPGTLDYGASYAWSVSASNSNGQSNYSNETIITTRPKQPTISVSAQATSITATVTGLTPSYNLVYVYLRDSNGNGLDTKTVTGNNQSVTFTGLTAGINYQVNGRSSVTVSGGTVLSFFSTIIPVKTSNRPLNWEWTTVEINAFNNKGETTVLSYLRWNVFIDRVNEFRVYKGLSAIGGKMTSNDRKLYASSFRIVAQGIRDMTTTLNSSLTTIVVNDMVYGWYFNHLAAALTNIT